MTVAFFSADQETGEGETLWMKERVKFPALGDSVKCQTSRQQRVQGRREAMKINLLALASALPSFDVTPTRVPARAAKAGSASSAN